MRLLQLIGGIGWAWQSVPGAQVVGQVVAVVGLREAAVWHLAIGQDLPEDYCIRPPETQCINSSPILQRY